MDNDTMSNLTEIGKNLTSAVDKFASMMKNRSDYKLEEKKKRLELEDLKARIDVVKNSDVPMELNKDGITIYSPEAIELMSRAGHRLANQELKKQVNIENTLYETKNILEKEKENGRDVASSEPVKDDFMTQFYNSVGEISDVDMQLLWAKLLAGEIKQPQSFSLRTLNKLKMMTTNEAKLFEKVAPYIISNDCLINSGGVLNKYGISFENIMTLNECGIINLERMNKVFNETPRILYNNLLCTIDRKTDKKNPANEQVRINGYMLTSFGKELYKIIKVNYDNTFYLSFARNLKQMLKESHFVSCYEVIKKMSDDIVRTSEKDLLIES